VRQRRNAALFPNYFGQTCSLIVIDSTRNWSKSIVPTFSKIA